MINKKIKSYSPKTLKSFWKHRVNGWLLNDINKCVRDRANIGAMTLICCYIDFFGGLIKPKADTRNKFYAFIEQYLKSTDKNYDFWKCKLYEDFRCGLVHEAIMKKDTGIFRSDEQDGKYLQHLGVSQSLLYVDLVQFNKDFRKAVKRLKGDLDSEISKRKLAIQRLQYLGWDVKK